MAKPKVFINQINKYIKNNKESYHFTNENEVLEKIDRIDNMNLVSKINEYFLSDNFVYKFRAKIVLKDKSERIVDVVALKDNNLITIDEEKINIDDIVDIKKAN